MADQAHAGRKLSFAERALRQVSAREIFTGALLHLEQDESSFSTEVLTLFGNVLIESNHVYDYAEQVLKRLSHGGQNKQDRLQLLSLFKRATDEIQRDGRSRDQRSYRRAHLTSMREQALDYAMHILDVEEAEISKLLAKKGWHKGIKTSHYQLAEACRIALQLDQRFNRRRIPTLDATT